MIAARHHCPHCSAPIAIAVSSRIVGPEFVGLFAEFERRLRVLPSPFTSRRPSRWPPC